MYNISRLNLIKINMDDCIYKAPKYKSKGALLY